MKYIALQATNLQNQIHTEEADSKGIIWGQFKWTVAYPTVIWDPC